MSELRNRPPKDLLEMFERRESDVRPSLPMPPSIRRRIRTRRGIGAVALATVCALIIGVAVRTLPSALDSRPADESPKPPSTQLQPTASGHTEVYRWRVVAGHVVDGRIPTELQTSSLAGGPWATVAVRSFDPTATAFTAMFLAAGQFLDRPSTTVVWGFVPPGSDRIVLKPGAGCDALTIPAEEAFSIPGETIGLWGANVRCSGPGTIVAQGSDGTAIATTGYTQPIPADAWALTTSRHGGVGWVLRRILDPPTGIGIGDAGIPNDIRSPIRGDRLSAATPIAWGMTPASEDGAFTFGISVREVDHVVLVVPGGDTVEATFTILPGDPFDVFWADVVGTTPIRLIAYDAACQVIANEPVNGAPPGDPPVGACTPNG
jgi:hypothetical protein